LLDDFIATPANYEKLEVVIIVNCSSTSTTKEYTSLVPITGTGDVVTIAGIEYINPSFLSVTTFTDGIYTIQVKSTDLSSVTTTDTGCLLVDCNKKCKIAVTDTNSMLYYYWIDKIQDCTCDCTKLCTLYNLITEEDECNC